MARVFADLNLLVLAEDRSPKPQGLRARVRTALKLGYETIALNTVITNFPSKPSKKSKTSEFEIPPPLKFELTDEDKAYVQDKGKIPKILNRITLVVEDTMQLHRLSSAAVRQYDIIAVQPNAEKLLQALSNTYDVDLVSFNVQDTHPSQLRKPQIKLMLDHGISFEINYVPAIRDVSIRRATIAFAQNFIELCRGKNVIMSSGAEKPLEIRAPYDVANLGLLFGLNSAQSKDAVTTNIRNLMQHAAARRIGKSLVSVVRKSDIPAEEKWKLASSREEASKSRGIKRKLSDSEADSDL